MASNAAPPPTNLSRHAPWLLIGCATLLVLCLSLCLISVTVVRLTGIEVLLPLMERFNRSNAPTAPASEPQPLFRDTFRDNAAGWPLFKRDKSEVRLEQGRLVLIVSGPDGVTQSTGGRVFDNLRLEVDSGLLDGPPETSYGLIFRHQDAANYYAFEVDGLGQFRLGKVVRGAYSPLLPAAPSDRVQPGQALNHLSVRAVGNQISVAVNGVEVGQVTDATFPSGHIGMRASLARMGVGQVVFGNLEVFAP